MKNFDEYLKEKEPEKREKGYAWQTAIGLQEVDGLKPSDYLIKTAQKHIEGDISIDEVQSLIKSYYDSKDVRNEKDFETEEADKVSANITRLLNERSFSFSLTGITSIHRRIFDGVFPFAGQIREYNITKKEWVLRGDTVLYVSAPDIRQTIEYDLEKEKSFDYSSLTRDQIISHLAKFISGLWQIHPFAEGNTRTTAVFTIQYLRSLGFDVENDLFAKHSWYFRNALVRSNYQNLKNGVTSTNEFLDKFFRNLILGETHELKNRFMVIHAPKNWDENPQKQPMTEEHIEAIPVNIQCLINALANDQLSMKELMERMEFKHRPTFVKNFLKPALEGGFLQLLHPETPKHPKQKYLLSLKEKMFLERR